MRNESDFRLDDLRLRSSTAPGGGHADPEEPSRLRQVFSPLTLRFLAVNLTAPVLLVLGLLFLDQYEDTLIAAELESLRTHGALMAAAIGEGAVSLENENGEISLFTNSAALRVLQPEQARQMLRRLSGLAEIRAQLFDRNGEMLADTRSFGPGGAVQVIDLPSLNDKTDTGLFRRLYDRTFGRYAYDRSLEPYVDHNAAVAGDYKEVMRSLETGDSQSTVRLRADRQRVLSVSIPVQYYKQVAGALLVTRDGRNIDRRLFAVRGSILGMFAWVLALTVLTSLYLAGTVARPIRRLAFAAMQVRQAKSRRYTIPDMTKRSDEIGELSAALRDMTESLWRRLDAIEHFAADVAHEIKNPLTSLRSAVETVARVKDREQQKKLMSIIMDDVMRLDRLISEISDASRLDAELSRAEMSVVQVQPLIHALAEVQNANDNPEAPRVRIVEDLGDKVPLTVFGLESRLGQVFRNLIGNAVSFSPPRGEITIRAAHEGRFVVIAVEDQGPGIPSGKEDAIFNRFYSERPEGEKFGTHSGLGLSISKQIVEAHRGVIYAENIIAEDGSVRGARFIAKFLSA